MLHHPASKPSESPRKRAIAAGDRTFSSTPCRNCGNCLRYTASGRCKVCSDRQARTFKLIPNLTRETP
jgi:recombinational DNA repair protein RecR